MSANESAAFIYIYIYIYIYISIVYLCSRRPRFNPRSSHAKDFKRKKKVPDASLLNTQHYKEWNMGKWSNPGKGVEPSPTSW